MFLLFRGLLAGNTTAGVVWVGIVMYHQRQLHAELAARGLTGLSAEAGGWTYLLHLPLVLVLLTAAFGLGFWLGIGR